MGKTYFGMSNSLLPSWYSKLKGTDKQLPETSIGSSEGSPTGLARSLGLQRAKARADAVKSEAGNRHVHRASKSIDALYVLSKMKEGVDPMDIMDDASNGGADTPRADKDMNQVTISLIENHLNTKEALWDQEFSSMSSYRSDLEDYLARNKVMNVEGGDEEDEALPPLLRNPHIAEFDIVECSSGGESCAEEFPVLREEDEEASLPESSVRGTGLPKKRRNHNDNSFSACLPSEIKGVVADSIPLVKYSHNPYQDFRESMLEMIQEKGLYSWNDLEELLYCYLSLNSPEHHEVIKQSFSDAWHELGLMVPEEEGLNTVKGCSSVYSSRE